MKVFESKDSHVVKVVHSDTSETCIKNVSSIDVNMDSMSVQSTDHHKFSLFPSVSGGCPFKCSFCYLTIDDVPFTRIQYDAIIKHMKDTNLLSKHLTKNRYAKICWMGMGEAILYPEVVKSSSITR